jgi:hypothetical protein
MKTIKKNHLLKTMAPALLLLFISTAYAADQPKVSPGPASPQQTELKAPAASGAGEMAQKQTTVTGTIVAHKNKAGKVVSYALQEDGGQSLMLSKHGKGKALRKMVGQKIEATGTLQESKGQRWITVQEFKEIK